ncbi:hypothetical protein EMIHUDRAFT_245564 [Emiliania huxleyi CCMP1516]|uniref:Parahox neighbor n=2 Tax=Emiliania huxleyi TaxID=2903 RepID=A0A0D3IX17_EMIH1|nr:hypothetical protein EMIHUDRAFT_245564 [Emiliania huxleyi CCMP1516]EOD15802.1 hypothetical protein EMIHUDRAFT_245564 [Emiliania huxleyi CCMP1516]|eukprot:XP_005768231.1 hypothetical protein EMIHUDRAFT_245564 [Emiliania huxleyi CCMP1516]
MSPLLEVAQISTIPSSEFIAALGGCYEKSPWVAERAHAAAPFASLAALASALREAVDGATDAERLALLRSHPDLAGKAALAGELTSESTAEQCHAGLSSLSADELARFTKLNEAYTARFGFPFILAVRNANKATIFAAFERRVHKIAWMRLNELVRPNPTGFLTCHVLDTARGCPAAGMRIELKRRVESSNGARGTRTRVRKTCGAQTQSTDAVTHAAAVGPGGGGGDSWAEVGSFLTNEDGRIVGALSASSGAKAAGTARRGPVLKDGAMARGVYEWTFHVGDYFAAAGATFAPCGTPFLGQVPLRFGIDDAESHYHVPLLCSPFSFSTYRGS